jgi:hypothetical protein
VADWLALRSDTSRQPIVPVASTTAASATHAPLPTGLRTLFPFVHCSCD